MDQQGDHSQLDFPGLDFFPQIFRGPSHHHAGDENPNDHIQEHVDHPHALSPENAV